jgi:putrescine aminotransferase
VGYRAGLHVARQGLTSGYLPLGASVVRDEIAEVLIHGGYLAHGFTYSGHPTTCAAALANIRVIEEEKAHRAHAR